MPFSGLELEPRSASMPKDSHTSAMICPSPLGLVKMVPGTWPNHS